MLEIKFWSTCVKIASQLAVCLFVEMLFLWRQYLIFVIKDSLPTHVILWWFIDGVVFLILEIDSTQDPSRLTTKILALLNLCACHFSMSRVFFMCVCVRVCVPGGKPLPSVAWMGTLYCDSQIPSCYVAEANTTGVLRAASRYKGSSYIQTKCLHISQCLKDRAFSHGEVSVWHTRTNCAVWWITCHGFGEVSAGSWTSPVFKKEVNRRSQTAAVLLCERKRTYLCCSVFFFFFLCSGHGHILGLD